MDEGACDRHSGGVDSRNGHSPARLRRSIFWACLLVGVLVLAEAGAWLTYHLRFPPHVRHAIETAIGLREAPTNTMPRFISHPYFNYVSNPAFAYENGYQPHNAWGFRDQACCGTKPSGHLRIVAIGGSTTYGLYFTYHKNVWPALLEGKLRSRFGDRIEVINAGVPNYTTFELIGLTAMILPELAPDIVLIHTGLNDAFAVVYRDEGGPDNRYFRRAWSYRPLPATLAAGMRVSYLIRLFGSFWASSEGFRPGDMAVAIQHPTPPEEDMLANARKASGKYFRRNLQTLMALCRNMKAVPVLINQPLNPEREQTAEPHHRAVVGAVLRNNAILAQIAAENGAVAIDVYSRMREPAYFVDAAHVSKAGMERKAETVAEGLASVVERFLPPRPNR